MMARIFDPEKGTWVLLSFIAFFGVIIAVNTIFITNALSSYSGVVTDNPYRKGIAYNEVLKTAEEQPDIIQSAIYENGMLQWSLSTKDGEPITANVTADMVLAIKDGYDYLAPLQQVKPGLYEVELSAPHKGRWQAHLKASWNNEQYQTLLPIVIK